MKIKGLAVIVENELEYKIIQNFLNIHYLDWVPQMATTETGVIINYSIKSFFRPVLLVQ